MAIDHIPISENITMETLGFSHGIFSGARDVHDPGLLHRRPWYS